MVAFQSGGLHGDQRWVGDNVLRGPPAHGLFRSEAPHRKVVLRAAPALWVLVFSHGRLGWILWPYAEGGLVRRGRRTPLLFGPEAMRLSKVHGAGVLRMK